MFINYWIIVGAELVIPSRWKVLLIFYGAHLDQALHENPTEFDPWRWAEDYKEMSKKVSVWWWSEALSRSRTG
ncbi:unnamed protein product [Prunus armeniaca]